MIQIDMNTEELRKNYDVIRQELRQKGLAADMATASSPITSLYSTQSGYNWQGKDPDYIPDFGTIGITHDYGNTVKWKIVRGRDFSRSFQDSTSMIVNESALKILHFKDPLGATVQWGERNFQVVGVVKDIVMTSPYNPVEPTIYILSYDWANSMLVRLGDDKSTLDAIAGMGPVFQKI